LLAVRSFRGLSVAAARRTSRTRDRHLAEPIFISRVGGTQRGDRRWQRLEAKSAGRDRSSVVEATTWAP
jgi:hypothetical protein